MHPRTGNSQGLFISISLPFCIGKRPSCRQLIVSNAKYEDAMKICNDILQKEFCDEQIKIQVAVHQCRILFYMGNSLECVSKGLDALTSFEARLPSFLDRPAEAA